MNICFFSRSTFIHGNGGMENHLKTITEGLAKKGHNVYVITTPTKTEKDYEEINGVKYYFLKFGKSGQYSFLYWLLSKKIFETLHKKLNFDIVVSESVGGYSYAKNLIKKYTLPFVAINHGTALNEIKSQLNAIKSPFDLIKVPLGAIIDRVLLFYLRWERTVYKKADAIIAVSNEMAKDIINQYHVKPFKVFTVFNGIDTNIFKRKKEKGEEVRKRYNIKLNEKLILMLGRIEKLKGFQYGVYALKEILKQKENVKLMIVGRGGYENKLKELTKKLDLESKVIFAGEVENRECPDYYNACDIFINPSLHVEAFPTVLIEVMACGRPVISTNLGGTRSAIESGENGILINSADPKEIADAVLKLLNNQTLAENLSKKAEEKAIKIFTIENSINGTERILRWALEYKNAEQNFKIKSENFECLANSIKTFIRFKGLEKHLLIINKTIETSKCPVGSPIFMIRVDDFPRWDIDTKEFLKFHSVLKSYNLPYLLGITPNLCQNPLQLNSKNYRKLSQEEIDILNKISKENVEIALHGFTHQTINKNFNTELIGLTKKELEEKILETINVLRPLNIKPEVFIPPFNTLDKLSISTLSKYFKLICGGPESIEFLNLLPPQKIDSVFYVPSYEGAYGTAKNIIKFIKKVKSIKKKIVIPLTLHWAWEYKYNFKNLENLCLELKNQKVIKWSELWQNI